MTRKLRWSLCLALPLCFAAPVVGQEEEERPEPVESAEHGIHGEHAGHEMGESMMHHDPAAIEVAVRTTVSRFHDALGRGDGQAALELLHPEARIYESGHAETREEYESGHLGTDMAFLAAVTRETTWDRVVPGRGMALYLSESHVTGTFRDREIDSRGVETMVLVPTGDGWRIRHIHWSSR